MKKQKKPDADMTKVLEVAAEMQGSLKFKDPVSLKIAGRFEGVLETKGSLEIGTQADVLADIHGEEIIIGGHAKGNLIATKSLKLKSTAVLHGDITVAFLNIDSGAIFEGNCSMNAEQEKEKRCLNERELADYLQVDMNKIRDWVNKSSLPSELVNNKRSFTKEKVDKWVLENKVNVG